MKKNNLYNRIYEQSFSLFLTFSFYALFFIFLLSCEDEKSLDTVKVSGNNIVLPSKEPSYSSGIKQSTAKNKDYFVEKRGGEINTLWKITHTISPTNK